MQTNSELTREYFEIMDALDGDIDGRRAARAYMDRSTAIVHHQVVDSSFVPRLFNQRTYDTMKRTAETAHRVLCKVIERYLADPAYREVFELDPRLVDLILLPRGYDATLPFARLDTFLNEDDYSVKFCEFNGDGSSGMNENREITVSVARSETFRRFVATHRIESCELFASWVEEFLRIYNTYEHKAKKPHVAIVDYLENGVVDEFKMYARVFSTHNAYCTVCDVRDLSFDGAALRDSDGKKIDAVWRRCVTNDVMDHWDGSQALIEAVRAQKVALIGSFAGHLVHDKQIFRVLHDPRTLAFLTPDEQAFVKDTVPETRFLDAQHADLAAIRANKDAWIIKPADHYGADEVHAGCACTQEEWEAYLDRFAEGRSGVRFIAQTYVTPFKTETLPPDTGIEALSDDEVRRDPALYNNINGLYLFNGRFAGVFSRLGPLPTISKDMQGMTSATIWVDCDLDDEDPKDAEGAGAEAANAAVAQPAATEGVRA